MITGAQLRAARALLRWSAEKAAGAAGTTRKTLERLEQVDGVPSSRTETLAALQDAFEREGVEFVGSPADAPGVRLRTR